jgi:S1-C subfamily serine protease
MPEQRIRTLVLVLIILVTGLYAGYALGLYSPIAARNPSLNELAILERIGALEGQISALQQQINDMEIRNATVATPSLNSIYESVRGSIVTISGLVQTTDAFGNVAYDEILGSGFLANLTGEPLVVTNYHVANGMVNGSITFIDGEAYPFTILGLDKYSDLAILRPLAPAEKLRPLTVASSSTLKVGDVVIAIGNPFGLQSTLTSGIVSQLNRAIQTETAGRYNIAGVIQISTPINPGNSGGPLLDSYGRVVGITTAIISGSQNVGFAVPSDSLIREYSSLATSGTYTHPFIGITGLSMSYPIAKALNLRVTYGVLVQQVTQNGPADRAGIRPGTFTATVGGDQVYGGGDLIVAAGSARIQAMDDLSSVLDTMSPGQVVNITVVRGGEYLVVSVTLGVRP